MSTNDERPTVSEGAVEAAEGVFHRAYSDAVVAAPKMPGGGVTREGARTITATALRAALGAALPHLSPVQPDEAAILREWADWIEHGEQAAGLPEPFTLRTVIDWMRSGRRPFGTIARTAGDAGGEGA